MVKDAEVGKVRWPGPENARRIDKATDAIDTYSSTGRSCSRLRGPIRPRPATAQPAQDHGARRHLPGHRGGGWARTSSSASVLEPAFVRCAVALGGLRRAYTPSPARALPSHRPHRGRGVAIPSFHLGGGENAVMISPHQRVLARCPSVGHDDLADSKGATGYGRCGGAC